MYISRYNPPAQILALQPPQPRHSANQTNWRSPWIKLVDRGEQAYLPRSSPALIIQPTPTTLHQLSHQSQPTQVSQSANAPTPLPKNKPSPTADQPSSPVGNQKPARRIYVQGILVVRNVNEPPINSATPDSYSLIYHTPHHPIIEEKRAPLAPTEGIISPPPVVVSQQNLLEWIDGIRGLASLVIFTHNFSDLTWAQSHPEVLPLGSIYGLFRNGQLAVGMYFFLGGRVLAHSFLRSAFTRPMVPKDSHGVPIPGGKAARWTGPRWLSLSSSLFRRSIRLAFPAIIVALIQWRIASQGMLGDRPIRAAQILTPTALWEPMWNQIGNLGGLLQFCLDLFTNRGHQYMLSVGSALWTTYDQFWGSVLVYILAASVAQVGWVGRYLIYSAVCGSLWLINSPNMLYVLGLWLADLHAAGFIRKLHLLIANMIANETLPIVTEKALGGGIQAIIISTVLVIVFSEIIPQTVCATYALWIGAFCAKPVQILIYLFYPIVWPISRLLTKLIGEHSGVIYRPSELKELVNLHARKSEHGGDLAEDVVTIIGSAIDLQERVVQDLMNALDHCFMLNIDTQLNYKTMSAILTSGHSRIPVYENVITPSGTGRKIVGALLTKQLILIDPSLVAYPPLDRIVSILLLPNILAPIHSRTLERTGGFSPILDSQPNQDQHRIGPGLVSLTSSSFNSQASLSDNLGCFQLTECFIDRTFTSSMHGSTSIQGAFIVGKVVPEEWEDKKAGGGWKPLNPPIQIGLWPIPSIDEIQPEPLRKKPEPILQKSDHLAILDHILDHNSRSIPDYSKNFRTIDHVTSSTRLDEILSALEPAPDPPQEAFQEAFFLTHPTFPLLKRYLASFLLDPTDVPFVETPSTLRCFVCAVFLGLWWHQITFVAHDAGHSVSHNQAGFPNARPTHVLTPSNSSHAVDSIMTDGEPSGNHHQPNGQPYPQRGYASPPEIHRCGSQPYENYPPPPHGYEYSAPPMIAQDPSYLWLSPGLPSPSDPNRISANPRHATTSNQLKVRSRTLASVFSGSQSLNPVTIINPNSPPPARPVLMPVVVPTSSSISLGLR
ncbi:uncharacterized protein PGTG_22227 [Puccinia graminis f. sp. tritici CRL 75-36-700-3]|uniref:CNNM transmembrane domain-containing protein n=1 Tax=Puccinia graminis f. sp. tritici (strain CRL 75-36-700-3 / race SCCL) TaxID=418459 RepID=H6QTY2_PUCGT|nr:uncharacterized protein PGTG_22227 [Puccinia graminis f. sp. tritici CRL 75-36-700-3]EHS64396.1 hypothetical protein PGTG_22227 [Puccinia graminis f. sp. tritici CRL 75-36-700-3]